MDKQKSSELKLLFIEDIVSIRKHFIALIKEYFFKIYEASSAEEAYRIYKENHPDIIISDIHLPQINGIELVQKIREKDLNTKIIMLTSDESDNFLLKASELKLTKYLSKNIEPTEFKNTIKLAIKQLENFEVRRKNILELGNAYYWDFDNQLLIKNGSVIRTTKIELLILDYLFRHKNSVITYEELLDNVWKSDDISQRDLIKTSIKKLRRKLPEGIIKNVYGLGYKLSLE